MANRTAWLKTLIRVRWIGSGDSVAGDCPECGCDRLRGRYVVDRKSRIGFVILWCEACLHGIQVSRAGAPEGVPAWQLGDPASMVGVPDFRRVE